MDGPDELPFKAGQLAEARSFNLGFRGAWFRCKINNIASRKGIPECALEYYDFPGEKVSWTRVYQKPRGYSKNKRALMLRPQYPPIYNESEVPDANTSEVSVVKNGVWRVGDEVEWYKDECYWSAKVTKILSEEKVQVESYGLFFQAWQFCDDAYEIELPPPPAGEGLTYDVDCKDLRPSLDWTVEHGWSVSISKGGENHRPCARIIKPVDKGPLNLKIDASHETAKDFQPRAGSSFDSSFSSDTSSSLPLDVEKLKSTQKSEASIRRTSCSDNVSTSQIRDNEEDNSNGPTKRTRISASVPLNSMKNDTIEAAFLDLEELVSKVKWLKGILRCGTPSSNVGGPLWEFVEYRESSEPK